jgi:hypothetical protein
MTSDMLSLSARPPALPIGTHTAKLPCIIHNICNTEQYRGKAGGLLKGNRGIILKMAACTDATEYQKLSMWKNVTNLHAIG